MKLDDILTETPMMHHGSGSKFNVFSLDHMGTGEGAQAYGWGLYFTETKDIAKSYSPRDLDMEDEIMDLYKSAERRGDYTKLEMYERALMHDDADDIIAFYTHDNGYDDEFIDAAEEVAETLRKIESDKINMYTVRIDQEVIDSMIDWDKTLGSQSPHVQSVMKRYANSKFDDIKERALDDFAENGPGGYSQDRFERAMEEAITQGGYGDEFGESVWDELEEAAPNIDWDDVRDKADGIDSSDTGSQLYHMFGNSPKEASHTLDKLGILGITYLDGDSRNGGQGDSRNVVVFNPDNVTILTRNGERV